MNSQWGSRIFEVSSRPVTARPPCSRNSAPSSTDSSERHARPHTRGVETSSTNVSRMMPALENAEHRNYSSMRRHRRTLCVRSRRRSCSREPASPLSIRPTAANSPTSVFTSCFRSSAAGNSRGFCVWAKKGSGGDYSEVELSLLTAIADRASARLEQFVAAQLADEVEAADHQSLTRSRFMAKASHDLRQPLQALSLFAGALSQRSEDAQVGDLARNISRSTAALREMFDGLLDLSRIELGSVEPHLSDVALGPLFKRLESELSPIAEKKGLRLRIVPTTLSIESDRTLLGRILQNLVLNAIRYTDRGGVVLGARRRGDSVRLEVIDTGPGISEKDRQLIFKEFERITDDQRAAEEGLGLGLAIVERLAGLLGHRVELTSELEAGSRFTIVALRRQSDPKPDPAIHVADAVAGLEGRAVLVIDDDASIREASRALLENWGCKVATIATLAEIPHAIERLGGSVDAAIADYRLAGGETGTEAIRVLRDAVGYEIPAVLITGNSVGLDEMQTGGLPVLAKPLAPARLRSLLVHMFRTGQSSSSSID